MLKRSLVALTLVASPLTAQTPDLQCEAAQFGNNRIKITCVDSTGAIARATGQQIQHLYMQQALRQYGCQIPALDGVSEPSPEAVDCFHEKFGRPGPLTDPERRALEAAGVFATEEMMTRALTQRRITPAEDIDPGITFAKTIDHPDGAKFIHPTSQESWMGGGIELLGWTSSRRSSEGAVQIRWADPQAFDGPSLNFEVIGYGLEDFSYVPFQKYEVWGSYVADAFPVQSDYFDTFTTGMAEFPAASFKDWTAPLGGPDIEFVDMMILSEREFAGWATSFATLLERIGCAGPTTDRLERNLLAAFELRRSV